MLKIGFIAENWGEIQKKYLAKFETGRVSVRVAYSLLTTKLTLHGTIELAPHAIRQFTGGKHGPS